MHDRDACVEFEHRAQGLSINTKDPENRLSRRTSAAKQPTPQFNSISEAADDGPCVDPSIEGRSSGLKGGDYEGSQRNTGWRIDKSGWLLKTASTTKWGQSHKWASRFVVLSGGSLFYFKPQQLAAPAGIVMLDDSCVVSKGVLLRSPPSGAFTITLQASLRDLAYINVLHS